MSRRHRLYARLPTEKSNPRARHLDRLGVLDLVRLMNRESRRVAPAVGREASRIAKAANWVKESLARAGRVLFVGAGTSGRIGVMEAAECPPTFGTDPRRIRAAMAGGRRAVFRSREGAEDDPESGARAAGKLGKGDVVIGIAASGITPFVLGALRAARKNGARTVLVTANNRPPANPAELTIAPEVGPEILAGSTRLKSGTAAKMVLNAITMAAMVGLGKVYDRWMVDLKPVSFKLQLRALRLVADLGGVSSARARALLGKTKGDVKLAVLAARGRLSMKEARRRLQGARGSLRAALELSERFQ